MNQQTKSALCEEVREEMARILDGSAPTELYEHVADCDDCRDLKHEASQLAGWINSASSDYQHASDFEARLLAAVDARPKADAAPTTQKQPTAPAPEQVAPAPAPVATEVLAPSAEIGALVSEVMPISEARRAQTNADAPATAQTTSAQSPADVTLISVGSEPAKRTDTQVGEPLVQPMIETVATIANSTDTSAHQPVAASINTAAADKPAVKEPARVVEAPSINVVPFLRRRSVRVGLAGASLLAIAAAAAGVVFLGGSSGGLLGPSGDPWAGQVSAIGRPSADSRDGLSRCDLAGCSPVEVGAQITAGSTLRTDARTRAEVKLTDGTVVVLDRGSELVLDAKNPRAASLTRGAIVADVAHLENKPHAKIAMPGGSLEVLGTKFAVFADRDRSRVEVSRGVVQLTDTSGRSERVFAGEEGRLAVGRNVVVAASGTVADVVELAEIKPREQEGKDEPAPVRGLGELKARKPGQSDERGQAVRLVKHDVKVRIVDNVARTEIDETFQNDTNDELEGIYRFPLPPDAQIERLSLEVNGKLEDGAFVEKDRAAAIWRGVIQNAAPKAPKPVEEIVWVPGPWRDPALLEWKRGGRFELRIFPIPKNGARRIVIAYTQTLPSIGGLRRYTYPLPTDGSGTSPIEAAKFDVQLLGHDRGAGVHTRGYELKSGAGEGAAERLEMAATKFSPSGDLTVEYSLQDGDKELTAWAYSPSNDEAKPLPGAPLDNKPGTTVTPSVVDTKSPYVVLALRPKLPRTRDEQPRDHVLVVDSSRSMIGERFARAKSVATAMIEEMSANDRVMVLACDSACSGGAAGFSAPGSSTAENAGRFLSSVTPEGAADLSAMVRAARLAADGPANTDTKRPLNIVYIGDGGASAGPTRPDHLTAEVQRLFPAERGTINAAAIGADADTTLLAALARGGGGVVVPFVPGQKTRAAAVAVLGASYGTALRSPELTLPAGFSQVAPATLDTMRAGTETLVVARMNDASIDGEVTLKGKLGKEPFEQKYALKVVATTDAGNAFVPRLYAAHRIADLERNGGDETKNSIIDLSKRFAVASRHTSLLVLESEAMFQAFGLDRSRVAPRWTGETVTTKSGADGERDVPDADSGAEAKLDSLSRSGEEREFAKEKKVAAGPTATSAPGMGGGGFRASDPFSPAPPAAAAGKPAMRDEFFDDMPNRRRGGRRMIPMKKVYDRKGAFVTDIATWRGTESSKLVGAENASLARPDSRQATKDLFAQYSLHGRIDQAAQIADRWATRDAIDPEALIARADVAARKGDREQAIKILGSVVDVRPDDAVAQNRLASLLELTGDSARACAHRVALAEQKNSDAPAVASAIRCSRNLQNTTLAERLLADVPVAKKADVERELAKPSEDTSTLRGDVQLEASWDSDADLDIALIDPQGVRLSWLGGGKTKATARDATSTRSESVGFTNLGTGSYLVEITRAKALSDVSTVQGTLTIRAVGETRKIPFTLTGSRAEVGRVQIQYVSRLVPVDGTVSNPFNPPQVPRPQPPRPGPVIPFD